MSLWYLSMMVGALVLGDVIWFKSASISSEYIRESPELGGDSVSGPGSATGLCLTLTLALPSVTWQAWIVSKFPHNYEIYDLWFCPSLAHYLSSGTAGLPLCRRPRRKGQLHTWGLGGASRGFTGFRDAKDKVRISQTLLVSCWSCY